jgi:hypothetical protein
MLSGALTPSQARVPAAVRHRQVPSVKSTRKTVSLRMQPLVDPPFRNDEHHEKTAGVWVSDDGSLATSVRSLTARHLTIQGLLLKLEVLGGYQGQLMNPALRLLTGNQLSHVYACEQDFRQLACESSWANGNPATRAAFIDQARSWLVLDAGQAFIADSAQPSPMLISALAHLAELPLAARSSFSGLDVPCGVPAGDLGPLILDTARKLIRSGLGEAGITLSQPAADLVKHLGRHTLVHWLLADLPVVPTAPAPHASHSF